MKILLTGHKGFIGSRLLKRLDALNHVVITIEKTLLDHERWRELLTAYLQRSDLVFHVGAISDTSLQDSTEMLKYNYLFSKELFDAAQENKKKVVYSSSAACFGDDSTPSNIYGWSKLLAEDYGMARCDEFVSLRYFNVYGPGEEHKGSMASVAYQAWKKGFFKLFPTQPQRDFIYIDDVVDANLHAVTARKGIYEIGYGEARTFESLLDGMRMKYRYHKREAIPPWYQFYTCADKKKRLLGWIPKFNVESGAKKYIEYLTNGTKRKFNKKFKKRYLC